MSGGERIIGVFHNESSQSLYDILSWREICAKCKWEWIISSCIFYEILQFVRGPLNLSEQSQFSIIKGGRTWLILRIKIGFWTLFSRKFLSPQFPLLHYPDKWQCAAGAVHRRGQGGDKQQEEHRHRHLRLQGPRGQGLLRLRETQLRDKQQLWWQLRRQFSWHWPQHPPDGRDTAADQQDPGESAAAPAESEPETS